MLVAPALALTGTAARATVYGADERIRVYTTTDAPYRSIANIKFNNGSGCSGFLISPHTLATAAHCVAELTDRGRVLYPPRTYDVMLGRQGYSTPYGRCAVTGSWAHPLYKGSVDTFQNYDYGYLKLNCGSLPMPPSLKLTYTSRDLNGVNVMVAGYPGDLAPDDAPWQSTMWRDVGRIGLDTGPRLGYRIDSYGGQSGAPVLRYTRACGWCVVGIHTAGNHFRSYSGNSAVKLTYPVVENLKDGMSRGLYSLDQSAPVLAKPVASLPNPTSRTATYSISATDDAGVISDMRVKATGDADWRPWVPYSPSGTVILPDRFGDFTIWFQVKDPAGNVSSVRAANLVTRVRDVTGPALTGSVSKADPAGRVVSYSLNATDDYNAVTQMRVLVSGEDWRPWVPFSPTGTVVLPDGYGRFGVSFQVMDAAGNASAPLFAGAVTRTAPVTLTLRQIDNLGNLRSCGSSETAPCTDVVKKFRTTIDSPIVPNTNLLLKAWRNVNGSWVETSTSPFMLEAIAGRRTVDMTITANLLAGVWRFQAQVPRDGDISEFAASAYQYLRIS